MKLVVDMNLTPAWVAALRQGGYDAVHWSAIGDPRAADAEIMNWARANGHVVFTSDLDFTTILALTRAVGPSVVQLRSQDVLPNAIGHIVLRVLEEHSEALASGAVVSVDSLAARVRVLPIR
jgi:predicted nuclease of predicted toxin-antitoxin system